ncbi:unnamed protein product, partial [marine sediment metagenome]
MILTQADVDEFVNEYSDFQTEYCYRDEDLAMSSEERFCAWLVDNPQTIVAAGFQEYVGARQSPLYR